MSHDIMKNMLELRADFEDRFKDLGLFKPSFGFLENSFVVDVIENGNLTLKTIGRWRTEVIQKPLSFFIGILETYCACSYKIYKNYTLLKKRVYIVERNIFASLSTRKWK